MPRYPGPAHMPPNPPRARDKARSQLLAMMSMGVGDAVPTDLGGQRQPPERPNSRTGGRQRSEDARYETRLSATARLGTGA